ncbi:hypothetical protein AVT69_gp254 [Pseudomonas phage PhiPA3]|uniref:Uncharacterized protein 256 n=1 Tax=Pseudomonas phage PhiPA3 TaxID=998086 RepID=F8SJ97_BPPA3|nr:hypothetical protein AVT69_gp254 [Pseudomonas phage PhiPA3]AEH03679.1 hypothetical protein [Pseudomonas phage PhiPA3]
MARVQINSFKGLGELMGKPVEVKPEPVKKKKPKPVKREDLKKVEAPKPAESAKAEEPPKKAPKRKRVPPPPEKRVVYKAPTTIKFEKSASERALPDTRGVSELCKFKQELSKHSLELFGGVVRRVKDWSDSLFPIEETKFQKELIAQFQLIYNTKFVQKV